MLLSELERTSFAEVGEPKGYVTLELGRGPLRPIFHELPTRPMVIREVSLDDDATSTDARRRIREAIESSPPDAVLQLRVAHLTSAAEPWLTAAALREVAGERNVSVRIEGAFRRPTRRPHVPRAPEPQLGFSWT